MKQGFERQPLRLNHRYLIKDTMLDAALPAELPEAGRQTLRALILAELRRLPEGVLARYGLRPIQLQAWRAAQGL